MENEFLFIGLIFLFASFTQGYAGFAFQLISISLLTFFWDLKLAIPVCAMYGLVINIYLTFEMRSKISFSKIKSLLLSSFIGIPIGLYFLKSANAELIKFFLGVIIILFVIMSLTGVKTDLRLSAKSAYVFGFFSGILGGAFNTNGPPVLIYFLLQKIKADEFKAMISSFFLFSSLIIVIGHFAFGITNIYSINNFLTYLIFILVGQTAGNKLYKMVDSKYYKKLVLILLLVIGIKLLFG